MAISFEPAILDALREKHRTLEREEKLITKADLDNAYTLFRNRFGPEVLAGLQGEEILETIFFQHEIKDSLVYWLEYKNDEEFPSVFGGISGGSAYKYGLFQSKKTKEWMSGSPTKPKIIKVQEAIQLARERRGQLIAGTELIGMLPEQANPEQYRQLQNKLNEVAPDVAESSWGHKYYSILFPNKIDAFHNTDWQRFYLIKLLVEPPEMLGRYVAGGHFMALAEQLEIPMIHTARLLRDHYGTPHRYWRVGTSIGGKSIWDDMLNSSTAAVGWEEIHDLSTLTPDNEGLTQLKGLMIQAFPDFVPTQQGKQSKQLFNFVTKIGVDDIVLAGEGSSILGIGRVTGGYQFVDGSIAPHRREVEWIDVNGWKMTGREGLQTTVHEIKKIAANLITSERIIQLSETGILTVPESELQIPPPESFRDAFNNLEKNGELKQKAKEILLANRNASNHAITTDEIAEIVGYPNYRGVNLRYGILAKAVCDFFKINLKTNLLIFVRFETNPATGGRDTLLRLHPEVVQAIDMMDWKLTDGGPGDFSPPPPPLSLMVQRIQTVLSRKKQVILYGPPGTGKTYWASQAAEELAAREQFGRAFKDMGDQQKNRLHGDGIKPGLIRFCSFHPEYGYEHFIEGYRPEEADGQVVFRMRDGLFKQICRDAAESPDKNFYLIIDEINRGDIPRIFGELISLLEADKRGRTLYLPVSGEPFQAPPNVMVIGTMNTADRSIALLDAALRRRFGFIELMPDVYVLEDVAIENIPLRMWLKELNARILEHVGQDSRNLQVGHSYFLSNGKTVKKFEEFAAIIRNDIVPLLEEYCYEDYESLGNILGQALVDKKAKRIREEMFETKEDLLTALLEPSPDIATVEEPEDNAESEEDEDDEENINADGEE